MKQCFFVFTLLIGIQIPAIAQEWHLDLEEAKMIAEAEQKKILLVFQGSDWCAPCIKLDEEIWQTEDFRSYAKDHFVMVKVDFPRKKKNKLSPEQAAKNAVLAERYNLEGVFPLVVVMSPAAEILGKASYKRVEVEEYIDLLESFNG